MKKVLQEIADCFEVPPSHKGNGSGRQKIEKELRIFLTHTPLTDGQKTYLLSIASAGQKLKVYAYPNWKDSLDLQAKFIQQGLSEGLFKQIGSIYVALDFSEPSDWKTELQEIHTLMKDLIVNAPIITNGLDEVSFSFYAQAIKKLAEILPEFETALRDEGIDLKETRPETGVEYFTPMDRECWDSLSSTSTSPQPDPGRLDP